MITYVVIYTDSNEKKNVRLTTSCTRAENLVKTLMDQSDYLGISLFRLAPDVAPDKIAEWQKAVNVSYLADDWSWVI